MLIAGNAFCCQQLEFPVCVSRAPRLRWDFSSCSFKSNIGKEGSRRQTKKANKEGQFLRNPGDLWPLHLIPCQVYLIFIHSCRRGASGWTALPPDVCPACFFQARLNQTSSSGHTWAGAACKQAASLVFSWALGFNPVCCRKRKDKKAVMCSRRWSGCLWNRCGGSRCFQPVPLEMKHSGQVAQLGIHHVETDCCVSKRHITEPRQTQDLLETALLWWHAMQSVDQVISNQSTVVRLIVSKVDWFCTVQAHKPFTFSSISQRRHFHWLAGAAEAACYISSSDMKTSAGSAETWQGNRLCSNPRTIVFLIRTSCVCVTKTPKSWWQTVYVVWVKDRGKSYLYFDSCFSSQQSTVLDCSFGWS